MRIIFLGPPGVGKGTQSQRLVEYLGVPQVSTGDMLRQAIHEHSEVGELSEKFLNAGKLVPDPIIIKLVTQRLAQQDASHGYLLDGYPRNLGQAAALDEYLHERETPLDGVLALQVDQEEIVRRLTGRGRDDDRPEIVRERFDQYLRQTAPLAEYYRQRGLLYMIDGTGTTDAVFDRIKSVLEKIRRNHQ